MSPSTGSGAGLADADVVAEGVANAEVGAVGLLDRLLSLGGWERPWDQSRRRPLDEQTVRLALRGTTAQVPGGERPVTEG